MLNKLEQEGYIKKLPPNPRRVKNSLDLAQRDIETAKGLLKEKNYDWAFNIAYNSMLQSIRSLMFYRGYRPSSRNTYIAVIKFTEIVLDKDDSVFLDRMRRKRHQAVYDFSGTISSSEAHLIVNKANKLMKKVEDKLDKQFI